MKPQDYNKEGCTVVCKLMPLYRLEVFKELSAQKELRFTFLGDIKEQGGIESIGLDDVQSPNASINWIKTSNYFYKPELLLWQTGVLKRILTSKDKVFIFEGAVSHLPYWIFPLICRLFGKKVLFWTHGFRGTDKGIKKWIRTFFFKRLPHGLLLYGDRNKELMSKAGIKESKMFVIYNSLISIQQLKERKALQFSGTLKQDKSLNPDWFTVIFVGRLVPGKGVSLLLKAVNKLNQEGVKMNVVIIGDGPEKVQLKDYCHRNKLEDQLKFIGALYNEKELSDWFRVSDLLISPGNVGLNCIHALGYGVPVATHSDFEFQNPEVEAIVENVNGFFFKRDDIEDLSDKLRNWVKEKTDRSEIIEQCERTIAKTYNSENHAALIMNAVKTIGQ